MKPGDLVRLVKVPPHWEKEGFKIGDLAIMMEIDWEDPVGVGPNFEKGRGRFWFPHNNASMKWKAAHPFPLAVYSSFEIISDIKQ